jgi:hypothetical protein
MTYYFQVSKVKGIRHAGIESAAPFRVQVFKSGKVKVNFQVSKVKGIRHAGIKKKRCVDGHITSNNGKVKVNFRVSKVKRTRHAGIESAAPFRVQVSCGSKPRWGELLAPGLKCPGCSPGRRGRYS